MTSAKVRNEELHAFHKRQAARNRNAEPVDGVIKRCGRFNLPEEDTGIVEQSDFDSVT